ncbi:MAG: glycoside hydrolase family 5 protein [Propionibacteriaceae bacterium]|jgi:hypothetical protein|nr:glycoside hydrolase family 5 protein [Propionibacteriaceae bacterium]
MTTHGFLTTRGADILDPAGDRVTLRGTALGGWMLMENFITGFPSSESAMREAVREAVGPEAYGAFFDRLHTAFFDEADAAFLELQGLNALRIPVHYQWFEDDDAPFQLKESGFRALDRAVHLCARHRLYAIIDLHAAPGCQNQGWHSDNNTHKAVFWRQPHFQDRVVHLWEHLAARYKDNPWVGGYNLLNEPADPTRRAVGPFTGRLAHAVRAADPNHILFLDGNTYSTEFDVFGDVADDNFVYSSHDYAASGFSYGGPYPGFTLGEWVDKDYIEAKFLDRSAFARSTGTPIWVGEFGPVYTGDPERDEQRIQTLRDQLEIYRRHGAHWSLWTYKDVGLQGLVSVRPDSPYRQRFSGFLAKKKRLSADSWGGDGEGDVAATAPYREMFKREFPDFDPYPWGQWNYIKTLILNIGVAEALLGEYADLFRGLSPAQLESLADSFALASCEPRAALLDELRRDAEAAG